ncbi:AraC family transcriptional regulator [Streptomyces erythrochromogenes]|uniref:helix-turn-helix transcriptional regulator n=1 Tax=Streptomyces erythrochromogenes TaxID=285574 RepID=UPI003865A185|nr:AraC family transcriptional regulator [Streptomyces erythrochromogenes]WST98491.1 AraC family transcriptional regulator [Streptomyces erythrochromogenes]
MAIDTLAQGRLQLRPAPPALPAVPTPRHTEASAATSAAAEGCLVTETGHPPHLHTYHQFLYAPLGRVQVSALETSWPVELTTGLWIPAGITHSSRYSWDAVVVVETFDADRFDLPYHRPTLVSVTNEQKALLLSRMRSSQPHPHPAGPDVFVRLSATHPDALPLPMPTSPTALTVAEALARTPGDPRTASEYAADFYTSTTTLRRAFQAETGMPFSEWRTRMRLNHALDLLDQGQTVQTVSARVGFASTNGFILAFRRYFGRTPGNYARRAGEGPPGRA